MMYKIYTRANKMKKVIVHCIASNDTLTKKKKHFTKHGYSLILINSKSNRNEHLKLYAYGKLFILDKT